MKHRITDYLSSKDIESYSKLDLILKMYVDDEIEEIFSEKSFCDIEIFPDIENSKEKSIQINWRYFNLCASINFRENEYEYVIYVIGDAFEQVNNGFVKCNYDDFSFSDFIDQISILMKNHPSVSDNTDLVERQKAYSTIANISLRIPCFIIGILALYVIMSGNEIKLGSWFLLVIIIPLVIWFVFDIKSKR